jgi:hypothetical protein
VRPSLLDNLPPTCALGFRPGVAVGLEAESRLQLRADGRAYTLEGLTPGLWRAIQRLEATPATLAELSDRVEAADGPAGLPYLYFYLREFAFAGLLSVSVLAGEAPLLTLVPLRRDFALEWRPPEPECPYVLSRFAFLRRAGGLVLETPLAPVRVLLPGAAGATLIRALSRPVTLETLADAAGGPPAEAVSAALGLLAGVGLVTALDDDGRPAEDGNEALAQWEFHDLLFHARSRPGRTDQPYAATYPFLN